MQTKRVECEIGGRTLSIEYGANPHVSNDEGDSPWQLAHARGERAMIELVERTLEPECL